MRVQSIELAANQIGEGQRDPSCQAKSDEKENFAHHHRDDIAPQRPQHNADADFAHPTQDRVAITSYSPITASSIATAPKIAERLAPTGHVISILDLAADIRDLSTMSFTKRNLSLRIREQKVSFGAQLRSHLRHIHISSNGAILSDVGPCQKMVLEFLNGLG